MLLVALLTPRLTTTRLCAHRTYRRAATVTMPKVLCVAEKPSIAKAMAGILSGGQYTTVSLFIWVFRARVVVGKG